MLCRRNDTYKPRRRIRPGGRSLCVSRLIQRPAVVPLLEEEEDLEVILLIQGLRDGRLTKIGASDCSDDQSGYDPTCLSHHRYDRARQLGRLCPRQPGLQACVFGDEFNDVCQWASPVGEAIAGIVVRRWAVRTPAAWWDAIANYVKGRDHISIKECAIDQMCLAMAETDVTHGVRMRIGHVLRAIGWEGHYKRMKDGRTALRFRRHGSGRQSIKTNTLRQDSICRTRDVRS